MYKPSLKNIWSLIALCALSLILIVIAQNNHKVIKAQWFDQKIQAANKMQACMNELKKEFTSRGYVVDTMNDPNQTGLVGLNISTITTSPGALADRLTTLNPNFAAVMVDILRQSGLKAGDYIAVGITGANPGANLALYAAIETLGLKPIIVTSVGSSTYGANREDFTWLDMETALKNKGLISFRSQYSSIGGSNDIGRGLPPEGRENILAAMKRNSTQLIEGKDLQDNINIRMSLYKEAIPIEAKYEAFINIGAGLANVGNLVNAKLIRTGINRKLAEKDFKTPGVMMQFAKKNIPIIHIYNIEKLASEYNMPTEPSPLPKPGFGTVFMKTVNNVLIAWICLIILVCAIAIVVVFDRHDRHYLSNVVDPDDEL